MVGSNFRSDATIYGYLSASCRDLVSMLSRLDDYWTATTVIFTTPSSQTSTNAVTGMWKLLAMRVTIDGKRGRIGRAKLDDLDAEVTPQGWSAQWPAYRLRGESIYWVPAPLIAHTVTIDYLPTAIFRNSGGSPISELSAGTDTFDGVFGWEDWVVLHTAIKLKTDSGKDIQALKLELQEREASLLLAAEDRAAEDPEKIRDTWRSGYEDTESDYA